MKVYDAAHIRNIALLGHHGSGKTTLAEVMLYDSGALKRRGTVEAGTTQSDYHDSEHERGMSVFTSLLHAEWKGHKINLLDTPGYPDFAAEVVSALKVADTAMFVMDAVEGVQVGTEAAWRYAEQTEKPAMFVINKLDAAESSFRDLVAQIQERFGRAATCVQLPAGAGSRTIIDVLLMKQITYPEGGKPVIADIDEAFREEAERLHNTLIEDIAENDEGLLDLYFSQGELSEDQMREGLHHAMLRRELFPIFVCSATENIGIGRLMSFIDNVLPSPAELPPARLEAGEELTADPDGEPALFVWRTMSEPHVGDFSFFRVYRGTVRTGDELENAQTGNMERLGQPNGINGRERDPVDHMVAGDLGAFVKLKDTHTNNTLRAKGTGVVIEAIHYPEPRYTVAVRVAHQGDEDKLAQGLHQLVEEDPALVVTHDPHLSQILLAGQGELHLAVAQYRLEHRFGAEVVFGEPRISYRETVQQRARAQYRHKKQTGGAGQFADISLLVEPLTETFDAPADIRPRQTETLVTDWGTRIEFVDAIVGGVIDMRRFFGAIQKGISEALQQGPVAGYPVGDVRVVIYDGGMHAVDSNENAFKTAARHAFQEAFREARPVLLEPLHHVEITVPSDHTGDVMSDLNSRRGQIQGIHTNGLFQRIEADVPEAELYRYATHLRSITHGQGLHRATFARYAPMPRHVQQDMVTA